MKKLLLFLLMIFPVIALGQVVIDLDKTYIDSSWASITVVDSLIITNLASDNLVVLNPTSTGKVDTTETSDISEITIDTLDFNYGKVNSQILVGDGSSNGRVSIVSDVSDTAWFSIIDGGANPDTVVVEGDAGLVFRWGNGSVVTNVDTTWINGIKIENKNGCFAIDSLINADHIKANNSDGLLLTEDGGSGIFIKDGGQIGIGTTDPSSIIHIKANTPGTVGIYPAGQLIIQNPADNVWANAVITGYESDGNGDPHNQLWYLGSSSVSNSNITLLNRRNSSLSLGTNNISRLTVLGNGDVGINDETPTYKLDVNGTTRVTGDLTASSYISSHNEDTDFDTDEVLTTTIADTEYGIIIVRESTGNEACIYLIAGGNIEKISVDATFTVTKDNAATYNVYFEPNIIKIQNKVGDDKNIRIGLYGI